MLNILLQESHYISFDYAIMDRGTTDISGYIEMKEYREWRFRRPMIRLMPNPNHQIIIWKEGYNAFIVSQYGDDLNKIYMDTTREDIKRALDEVPIKREVHSVDNKTVEMITGGQVRLVRASMKGVR